MIKDMKTRISKLNIDFDFEAYWEIIYLILLAFFVGMRFLLSTMFTIYWPKYFYRTLTVIGVVLVLLHLMMAKDISKKEIAAMLVVTFVFMMSHYVSGYDFLVDLLILILGAYRVNFRNILKTYIAVWSVLLEVAIVGAMTGAAENLVYLRGGTERPRMALGICYPTDLAAYVLVLMFAYACIREEYITYIELGIMEVLSLIVYWITEARTDAILMQLLIILEIIMKIFLYKKAYARYLKKIRKIYYVFPVVLVEMIWILTVLYDQENSIWRFIDNKILSNRLLYGNKALENYGVSAFGQYVTEKGFGGSTILPDDYCFIDSSFISIGIKYGMIFLFTVLLIYMYEFFVCENKKKLVWGIILQLVCMQGIMEHHFIQYWYCPFLLLLFSQVEKKEGLSKKNQSINRVIDLN